MILSIDNRESKIKEYFHKHDIIQNIEFSNLDIGDFIFKKDNKIEYLIERKTLKDILQSIKDGRYREQKCRMLDHVSKDRILYIVEDIETIHMFDDKNKNMINGFILNTILRDNMHVLCTLNINHTIDIIRRIYIKLSDSKNRVLDISDSHSDNYVSTLKIKKKENMNPERCFLIQLCQIPGISHTLASAIVSKYPSFILLYQEFLKESNSSFLENIEVVGSKKNRKLGKKTAFKICEYLQFPLNT